jgi:hypothetical protein
VTIGGGWRCSVWGGRGRFAGLSSFSTLFWSGRVWRGGRAFRWWPVVRWPIRTRRARGWSSGVPRASVRGGGGRGGAGDGSVGRGR